MPASIAALEGICAAFNAHDLDAIMAYFVALDPQAFYRSGVELQFIQPFRRDAISLLPAISELVGEIPASLVGVAPFLGLVVSGLVAWVTRPGPTSFALCVGLGLLATVLVSKVGFLNYYVFIGTALLVAGVTWPTDNPASLRRESRASV